MVKRTIQCRCLCHHLKGCHSLTSILIAVNHILYLFTNAVLLMYLNLASMLLMNEFNKITRKVACNKMNTHERLLISIFIYSVTIYVFIYICIFSFILIEKSS